MISLFLQHQPLDEQDRSGSSLSVDAAAAVLHLNKKTSGGAPANKGVLGLLFGRTFGGRA